MGVGSAASNHWKKAMKMGLLLFRSGFNSSKCKTMAKMTVARIKLLRNKRDVVIKQMRRDIAMLLDSGQDATARIRVEHVIREQNIMAANELIELFCDLVVARLAIISKQRECPADLKEGISSLIFAAPRCSEIPELMSIRDVFQKKYGKDFVSAATDLRPNAGVNRLLIEKLSVKTPPGETKLKFLKEIAKEYHVQWDTTESAEELLKPPEERIEGPVNFASAASFPLKPASSQSPELNNSSERKSNIKSVQELASAAGVAAEKALAAAEAAILLANNGSHMSRSQESMNNNIISRNSTVKFTPNNSTNSRASENQSERMRKTNSSEYSSGLNAQEDEQSRKVYRRQSYNCQRSSNIKFDESDADEEEIEMESPPSNYADVDTRKMNRRHSYNGPPAPAAAEFKFNESDEEEFDHRPSNGTDRPPYRPAPGIPAQQVHPKFPDYDTIAARFEALKHHKSNTRD